MYKTISKTILIALLLMLSTAVFAQKQDPNAIIGKVGDKAYTYEEYDRILNNYVAFHAQGKKLSKEELSKLNNQCWEELVGRYIYDLEIKSRKLKPSDAELLAEAKKNPPDAVKSIQDLRVNNRFDKAKYEQALSSNAEFKRSVLDYINQTYQYTKLYGVLKSGVKADADSVRRDWDKNHDTADARIIYFDYNKLAQIKSTEEDAQQYYEQNKENYRKEKGRSYRYYRFAKTPSAEDSLATRALVDSLYKELQNGADFAKLAEQYSKDPGSAAKGGDLGFFSRGRMVKPFEDACFNTKPGDLAAPVESQFGWHIIEVTDSRTEAGKEEVKARHILIRYEMSESNIKRMKSESNTLFQTAWQTGLVPAAALYDYELSTTPYFNEKERVIQGIGNAPELIAFAFANPVGTLHGLHTAANGDIYILEIADSLDVYYTPYAAEKNAIRNKLTLEKKVNQMKSYAENFYQNVAKEDYFKMAEADSIIVIESSNIKRGSQLPTIGKIDVLTEAILAQEAGGYTELVNHNNYWYLAHVTQRTKPDPKQWEKEKKELISKATESLQQQHLNSWYYAQKRLITIEDNRKEFYELSSPGGKQNIQLSPQ